MKFWYRLGLCLLVLFPLQLTRAQTISRVNAYTFSTFTGTFVDITTTGTRFTYSGGVDTGSATFALPFVFPYDGTSLAAGSNVVVSTNGAISLATAKSLNGPAIGNSAKPGLLGIFSGDMVAGSGGSNFDYYQVTGTAPNRVLIIEYHAIHFPGVGAGSGGGGGGAGAPLSKMEVKLYETTGVIEFIYGDHNYFFGPTTLTATIGLNGYTTPSFRYIVYASNVQTSPATDIRWTPATAGTSPQVSFDATQLFRFAKKMLRDTLTQYVHVTASSAPIVFNGFSIIGLDSTSYSFGHLPSSPLPVGFTD